MNDSRLCCDIGFASVNHFGEELCGDHVKITDGPDGSTVVVLADGLGSGVKASILSTLTSTIISSMIANGMSLSDCVESIASTLPVCSERKVAYSTFTIVHILCNGRAEIIQYDNPHLIMLRGGQIFEYAETPIEIDGKTVYRSTVELQDGDAFAMFSDGALNASEGQFLDLSWDRAAIASFMKMTYDAALSAKNLSSTLLSACDNMYGGKPGDDVTVCTVKMRQRKTVNLLMGPPQNDDDLEGMLKEYFSRPGKRIICGGTTSKLAARYLGTHVDESLPLVLDPDIPPTARIEGVDITTEGVITMTRVLEYARDYAGENKRYSEWEFKKDGASLIAKALLDEATDISFFIGRAMNPAHQNPDLPVDFNIKMRIVEQLSAILSTMGKRVETKYY